MSKDIVTMKTALFGGFKKADVLAYVEKLQLDSADIKSRLEEKINEASEMQKRINELEQKLTLLDVTNKKLAECETEKSDLTAKLAVAISENEQYRGKIADYEAKSEKMKRAEKQIGAAYIDARRYSEEIVSNAKAKAKDIGAIASQDIKRESSEIEILLKDVDAISRKFNLSLEQLHKDVYALSSKLNASASALLNVHTELTSIESSDFENNSKIPEDAVRIEQADDGSGLTIISYPPNTDFNEDLNITFESDYGKHQVEG